MAVLARGLIPILVLALWVYCVLDAIATEESRVQNLPKLLWLLLVVFVPLVGSIAWLLLGRPSGMGWRPGDTTPRQGRSGPHPSEPDRPVFRARGERTPLRETREEAIRRYEEEKRRREEVRRLEEQLRQPDASDAPPPELDEAEGRDDDDPGAGS